MIGAGVYDDACTQALQSTKAESVVLMVIDGKNGHGFSVQSTDPSFHRKLPDLLRKLADLMDKDNLKTNN